MRIATIILLFIFTNISTIAQVCSNGQFVMNNTGYTEAQSIVNTTDGGSIVAGITTSSGAGQEDIFVTKFDNQNNVEWSNTIGSSSRERGFPVNVIQTTNGFVVSLNSSLYSSS